MYITLIIQTDSNKCIDKELLISPSLLQLWRTGADRLQYSAEEDGDLDVSVKAKSIEEREINIT